MALTKPYFYNDRIYPDSYYRQEPREYVEERFRKKYTLRVETSKRYYRQRAVPVRYTDWLQGGGPVPFHQEVEREPLLKVYISKEDYDNLVEKERYVEDLESEVKHLDKLRRELLEEASIRSKNSAVQKAYEKYQMLLELSK